MAIESGKLKCTDPGCAWRGTEEEAFEGRNPFDPSEVVYGCPQCREVETLEAVCDTKGCWDLVCQGAPGQDGYRWSCHAHGPPRMT